MTMGSNVPTMPQWGGVSYQFNIYPLVLVFVTDIFLNLVVGKRGIFFPNGFGQNKLYQAVLCQLKIFSVSGNL